MRADETSLHQTWIDPAGGARNWDLHIDYFGGPASVPQSNDGVFVTLGERIPKWPGIAKALQAAPYSLDDYDYIGVADDDLVVDAASWSRAFETAAEHDLAACQLSLLHGSFFGEQSTLRQPGLKLHYVSRVEQMAMIARADIFRQLIPYMPEPDNLWAIDHVVAHLAAKAGGRIAVLDNASVLHTRRFWVGPAYGADAGNWEKMLKTERDFLAKHNIPWVKQETTSGLDRRGRPVQKIWWRQLAALPPRALRRVRDITRRARIAVAADGEVWLLRRFGGVALGKVDPSRVPAPGAS